jgi:hypothetical protein
MRVQALVIGLAAFVLGLVAGLVISPGGDADKPKGPTYLATDDTPSTSPQPEQPQPPAPEPQTRPEPPAATPPEPEAPGEAQSPYEAWLATIEVEAPLAGTGRIWGTVTSLGQPVAGATVRARPPYPQRFPSSGTLEEQLEHRARMALFDDQAASETVTASDGTYEFTTLGEGEYTLSVSADGHRMTSRAHDRHTPDAEVNLVMRPVAYLVLDVRLPDGSQPERAQVSVSHGSSTSGAAWTPASPEVEIVPGPVSVAVQSGEYVGDEFAVSAAGGERVRRTVQLKTAGMIICRIQLPAGAPTMRFRIHKEQDPPAEPPTSFSGFGDSIDERTSKQFGPLVPGRYRLILVSDRRIVAWQDVDVADRQVEVVITPDIAVPKVEDHIPLRVLDPAGQPVLQAGFVVAWTQNGSRSRGPAQPINRGDGLFWLPRTQPEARFVREGVPVIYEIKVTATGLGEMTVTYPAADSHELVVRFQESASLEVIVPGADGSPYRGDLRVFLVAEGPRTSGRPEYIRPPGDRTANMLRGTTTFPQLQPGKYKVVLLTVFKGDYREFEHPLMEQQVELSSGENSTTFSLPTLYSLTLVVPEGDSVPGMLTLMTPDEERVTLHVTSRRQRVGAFPPGRYQIRGGNEGIRFELAQDLEVRLEMKPFTALRLYRIGEEGDAYDLGLRENDLLIAVDGEDPENPVELRQLVQRSFHRETTVWRVIRGGAYVDVRLSGEEVGAVRLAGGLTMEHSVRE